MKLTNDFWDKQRILEYRINVFNKLVDARAPEEMIRIARDQIMKSRAEIVAHEK